jgi:poly(hydroxyalkanoate) depolymerase family esterase
MFASGTTASAATGSVAQYAYQSSTGIVHFRVFTPSGYRRSHPVPLVVFVHGCNTTAEQQENASLYDPVAEKYGFIVMYPDNDDSAHPVQCWRFYDPSNEHRGQADVATIEGMTRAVMAMRSVDRLRVYEIGMSSGALITSDLGAAYPDVYAAIGNPKADSGRRGPRTTNSYYHPALAWARRDRESLASD